MLLLKNIQKSRIVTLFQLWEKDPDNFGVIWLPETLAKFSAEYNGFFRCNGCAQNWVAPQI